MDGIAEDKYEERVSESDTSEQTEDAIAESDIAPAESSEAEETAGNNTEA